MDKDRIDRVNRHQLAMELAEQALRCNQQKIDQDDFHDLVISAGTMLLIEQNGPEGLILVEKPKHARALAAALNTWADTKDHQ